MPQTEQTACVLLLDLPPNALCGIDLLSFTASARFRGIKNVPPGWHFVFTSPTDSISIRHGAWFHISDESTTRDVVVMKWDAAREDFVVEIDARELLQQRANVGALWRDALTPYRQSAATAPKETDGGDAVEETSDWPALTDCLTPTLLSRIFGHAQHSGWTMSSVSSAAADMDHIPGLSAGESRADRDAELAFARIDLKRTWRAGAVGRERTAGAMDRSWALTNVIETQLGSAAELLGEMQLAFVATLVLSNNSSMEQWKRIVTLLLTCTSAAATQPAFFTKFLGVLRLQLRHTQDVEGGLFDLSDENGSLLKKLLVRFRAGVHEMPASAARHTLGAALADVEAYLRAEYDWLLNEAYVRSGMVDLEDGERVPMDLDPADDDDEYTPAVVDTSAELLHEWNSQRGTGAKLQMSQARAHNGTRLHVEDLDSDEEELEQGIRREIYEEAAKPVRMQDRVVELDDDAAEPEDMDTRF